ncbi:MAG: glycogen synthase, partial [Anaerolineae bacterium]
MHIIHITSELAPIAKVGGLADVIYGLSKESVKCGHKVDILLPKYDCLHYDMLKHLKVEFRELISFEGPARYYNTIWSAELENLRLLLLEPHHPNYYFNRGCIYGCQDDIDRFAYFSRTSLEYIFKSGAQPDIIHIHDWPTALIAPLYKDLYANLGWKVGGILLTIHNLEHQGKCAAFNLTRVGLRGENYATPDKMEDPYSPGILNLLKGGIVYADWITTVSPTYEKEIKTPSGGCGLHATLIKAQHKLKGILNGIDEHFWNPQSDPHL